MRWREKSLVNVLNEKRESNERSRRMTDYSSQAEQHPLQLSKRCNLSWNNRFFERSRVTLWQELQRDTVWDTEKPEYHLSCSHPRRTTLKNEVAREFPINHLKKFQKITKYPSKFTADATGSIFLCFNEGVLGEFSRNCGNYSTEYSRWSVCSSLEGLTKIPYNIKDILIVSSLVSIRMAITSRDTGYHLGELLTFDHGLWSNTVEALGC